jgi:hypothetical protein
MELRDMRRPDVSIAFGSIVVVMTLFSWATVIQGAHDEPYESFRRSGAFSQMIVGTALISFWLCLSLAIIALVGAGQMSRRWLMALLWAAICIFYLAACPLGYLYDLEHFIIPYTGTATGR